MSNDADQDSGARGPTKRPTQRGLALSRSLQIVAVLVVLLIAGFTAHQQINSRQTAKDDATRQMWRLDMVLAEQTGRAVETIDFILRGVIDLAQIGADPGPTQDLLARRIVGVRQVLAIELTDKSGAIVVSSRPKPEATLPQSGLALLAQHAAKPDLGLLISEPVRDADGRWTTLLARRLNDHDGNFNGVAVAAMNLAYFDDFYRSVELSEKGAILLHRRDGIVLTRYPAQDNAIGASYAHLPPFRDILRSEIAGTVEMDSPLDGSRRILAIRALKAFPLAVNISVDEAAVLAGWRQQTWVYGSFAGVVALAVAWLLFQLASRTREVEKLLIGSRAARDSAEEANRLLLEQMEERARAEAALRQAQRVEVVGQLTGGVAHDFNNLLTVVLGNIDLLSDTLGPGPHAARLATMRAAAERGARLTGQLLAFARQQPMQPRAVDINGLVDDMAPLLRSAVGSHVTILLELSAALGPAMADPTQIELVILNLAINARDAMPGGGRIVIATGAHAVTEAAPDDELKPGAYVRIAVADNGSGMTPEVLARAFEPFFTTKPPGIGSGLGLSQVYGVSRQLGGITRITSEAGRGTTVTVLLPCAPVSDLPPSPAAAAAADRDQPPKKARLLVVDDDTDVRATTAALLRHLGYQVTEADGGTQALALLTSGEPVDLMVTDVVMPGMSGAELAQRVKQTRPLLPVVFVSGYADPGAIGRAIPQNRLLRKPFRTGDLTSMIDQALAARNSVRATPGP